MHCKKPTHVLQIFSEGSSFVSFRLHCGDKNYLGSQGVHKIQHEVAVE